MPLSMDAETDGLADTDAVNVVSLFDTRSGMATSFVRTDGLDGHLIRALDACEKNSAQQLVTFNGTGFDFRRIATGVADEVDKQRAAALALNSYDIMLDFACDKGYYSSLNSFSQATLDEAKSLDGESAVELWRAGNHQAVQDYCEHDAAITARLFEYGLAWGRLWRLTKSGQRRVWGLGEHGFSPASRALRATQRCPPDTSWMTDPPNVAGTADWALDLLS